MLTRELPELDPLFREAVDKALAGERLPPGLIEALLGAKGREFSVLILAADALRKRIVGDSVTYVINRNMNFTNVCSSRCAFCGFARDASDPDAYLLTMDQVRTKAREAGAYGATEICVQGGISPGGDLGYMVDLLKTIKTELPEVHIHAFSPMEIDHASRTSGLSVEATLRELVESGLDSMPGTAAEILVDRVRKLICPNKLTSQRWEEIILAAHGLGIRTTSTMMYGTVETLAERAMHLDKIRSIQERTGGFTEFVPLPFVHGLSPLSRILPGGPTGAEDLRVIAAARLAFGWSIPNVQASWVKMGRKLAQIGLICGANDLGGTLMEENISRSAGSTSGSLMTPVEMRRLIEDLGRKPAQRDTLYRLVDRPWKPRLWPTM